MYVCVRMTASERVMPFCASVHSSLVWCCQLLMRAKQWGIETGSATAVICQLAWAVNEGDCGKSRAHPRTFAPTRCTVAKVCTHFFERGCMRTNRWMHDKIFTYQDFQRSRRSHRNINVGFWRAYFVLHGWSLRNNTMCVSSTWPSTFLF